MDGETTSTSARPIVHFLFEPGNGGLDRVAILLANGMAARGLNSELWLTESEGPLASLISDVVTVRMVPSVSFGGRGVKLFQQIPALSRMIKQHRPAAIFSAGNQSNLTIALARKMAGTRDTKIIQKITNPISRPGMSGLVTAIRTARFKRTVARGDICLTLSEADAKAYAQLMPEVGNKFRPVKNAYVTNAMLDLGKEARTRRSSAPCKLLCVGRLEYQKDHANLIKALARIKNLPWQMHILGDGSLEAELKALASQLGVADRLEFAGFVDDPTSAYAASDIMVLSSRWEGLPAAPLEAMAAGCDVVTTDCSDGLTEMFAALGRPAVPVENDAALADAIASAMRNSATRSAMRAIAQQYSVEASVTDHLRIAGLG
ncbi:glycosyltransferase [Pontixanthobacter aestiaquae]|uniref:Glycosyltransferase n=1 Tax=Pontixanthobacter aestiaquae TaxID=1509367 RepID=A0A844Z4Z9_9SPHN|nr:glycosyltransferase [Pontixanthobacter aestiaquae]MDN3646437.1 glycosyltransferase [Pontixanthobacter aestiaquae]MXO82574.1 glycosyltransferase [Pontixanthobacter aestiaquae]